MLPANPSFLPVPRTAYYFSTTMKVNCKLPRKLKKHLKTSLMRRIGPWWKEKEVKITDYEINPRTGRKEVRGYTLG